MAIPEPLVRNQTERFITPSRALYRHQWLWDSCFHAIVLAHFDTARAQAELASVLEAQWPDGMIPHIRFGEAGNDYRPNAGDWGTGRGSSGITQPPLIASAAVYLHRRHPDHAFLERIYGPILAYHRWLHRHRDVDGTGLLAIVHPWESGTDNSPIFDEAIHDYLAAHPDAPLPPRADTSVVSREQRPRDDDYRFYWGLVESFAERGWQPAQMARHSPFLVGDVLFNSIWARANDDLAVLAEILGRAEEAATSRGWADATRRALGERCWHAGFFYAFDFRRGKQLRIATSSGFLPLWAGAMSASMTAELTHALGDPRRFGSPHGIPSTALEEPSFDPTCYWRGPVWINIHWLVAQGLRRQGFEDRAAELEGVSRRLVSTSGYREYYDPTNARGLGAPDFSWSTLADIM